MPCIEVVTRLEFPPAQVTHSPHSDTMRLKLL